MQKIQQHLLRESKCFKKEKKKLGRIVGINERKTKKSKKKIVYKKNFKAC